MSDGPGYCCTVESRDPDPYCPAVYRCQDYDHGAEWFDAWETADRRFSIDLEAGSMDRLPDVRPYLYYVGYWSHWELKAATDVPRMKKMSREEVEDHYVQLGRRYLVVERDRGYGYFLGQRDWSEVDKTHGRIPWAAFRGVPRTKEDVGFDDHHWTTIEFDTLRDGVLKTNLRAAMPYEHEVKVRPGHADWDLFIQWMYDPLVHGVYEIIHFYCDEAEIHQQRREEDGGRFLERHD